jgi:acetyltransferase EpsM
MTGAVPLLVIGASGHARVVIDSARQAGRHRLVGVVDPSVRAGTTVEALEVLGGDDSIGAIAAAWPSLACIIGIGDNATREEVASRIAGAHPQITFASVVHPAAVVAASATLGAGAFVAAGAVINPGARIGAHAIVNTGATVDHEAEIGDFASIGPNAALAGSVVVGRGAAVGIAACAIPGVRIGDTAIVGAGAVVVGDVASGETVAGVPARPLRPASPVS